MTTSFSFDVFLSHNSQDKPQVRRLAERLKAAGVRVWFDEWNIAAGDLIVEKVDEGLNQSRVLLLCISPNALSSGWVALERSTAIHRDPSNDGRRFIPLLLAACELPDTLRRYKCINFIDETADAFTELLGACLQEEGEAPPAPKPVAKAQIAKTRRRSWRKKPKKNIKTKGREPLAVLEQQLAGHKGMVRTIAVSPDGNWAVSGSADRSVTIWDLQTGECRAKMKGHTKEVKSVAISPDGTTIFSGSEDMQIRRWDVNTLEQSAVLKGHAHSVQGLTVSGDGKFLLSCSANEGPPTCRWWDISTNTQIRDKKDTNNVALYTVVANDSADFVICGGNPGLISIWDIQNSHSPVTLKGHSDIVRSVILTPDERYCISGSDDKTIKIWDLETHTCVGTLEGHQSSVYSVAFSPGSEIVASTGFTDHTVRLWDWKSGACLQVIELDRGWTPMSLAFSPDGSRLVISAAHGPIYVYRLAGGQPALPVDSTRRYVNAKVVLIGEGTVGKTSLAHRLINDEYVIKDRTHGMNVWRLDLPLPPDAELEREALLWDLAGQEDYRLIHQLFLEETALALLLVNPQNPDPFAEAGAWLKSLATAAGNQNSGREADRLLIYSQTDVGGMKLGSAKIERFIEEHGFTGWLPTSAKSGDNCSDKENGGEPSKLKQLIAESIPWNKLPWTSTPRLLAELKKAVMRMRDKRDIRLLRFSELAQRLDQALPEETIDESDVRTAVTLLANHGLARPLKFGDLVLLQPELINGYAASIIRSARAHTDEIGCVLETDIYDAAFDFTGVERLTHRPDEELLLRALVQTFLDHSLCIAEDTPKGRHLVFPSQYRREKDIPHEPDIFVSYSFSGEWQTVWTTLVVRLWYSNEFEHRELWRNAAELESAKGHLLGLKIDNQQGEGTGTISLYFDHQVPDELKAIFIEYVHRHLAKYGSGVTRDRRYICPDCGRPFKDLELIRELLGEGVKTIVCQKCRTEVELIDFIEQQLASDPVAQRILAMEETVTRTLDTQALEQILIGHMMAVSGEANQIFDPVNMLESGIHGEVEFKDDDGNASGQKIYVHLKSELADIRSRKLDGREVFDFSHDHHRESWIRQPGDVYLVIRQTDGETGKQTIRWMNATRYLKDPKNKGCRQIIFDGEELDMNAVWKARDTFFPPKPPTRKA